MKVSGNTVLVTGGATGIGYSMAEYFLRNGNNVIIIGRRRDRLMEAQKKHPELNIMTCDIASDEDRIKLIDWISANFTNLNILVNNAGIQREIDFTKGIRDFLSGDDEIAINLSAPIILTGLFVPVLTGKENAAVVNISSGLGFIPSARTPVYSATKAGMHAFSMALRYQLAKTGIKVFEIIPPAVDTELNPEGRAKRGYFKVDLKPDAFVEGVMKSFKEDVYEIGYGMTEDLIKANREDLDKSFTRMNSMW